MSTMPVTADVSPTVTAPHRSRAPVQRADAPRSLRLVAVSFGVTVVVTRLYLALTGYPQIGGEVYHLAHALWGGLLLLVGGMLVLLWADAWVHRVTAVCVGVGSGLFVDEVGKFITQANDYFTPLAAPIIYVVFLAVLGVATLARRTQLERPLVETEAQTETEPVDAVEPPGARTSALRATLLRVEAVLLPRWAHRLVLIAGSTLLGLASLVGLVILIVLVAGGPDSELVLDDQVVPPGSRPPMLVVAPQARRSSGRCCCSPRWPWSWAGTGGAPR